MEVILCWCKRMLRLHKKVKKISYKFRDIIRDTLINKLFDYFHITNGALIYSIITTNPVDIVISILAAKFGISKILVTLIIAFLI